LRVPVLARQQRVARGCPRGASETAVICCVPPRVSTATDTLSSSSSCSRAVAVHAMRPLPIAQYRVSRAAVPRTRVRSQLVAVDHLSPALPAGPHAVAGETSTACGERSRRPRVPVRALPRSGFLPLPTRALEQLADPRRPEVKPTRWERAHSWCFAPLSGHRQTIALGRAERPIPPSTGGRTGGSGCDGALTG